MLMSKKIPFTTQDLTISTTSASIIPFFTTIFFFIIVQEIPVKEIKYLVMKAILTKMQQNTFQMNR